jgi:hypothetical protein
MADDGGGAAAHPLAGLLVRACEVAELGDEARDLWRNSYGPQEFLMALSEAELQVDAIRLLAHLLPRREAIWWAWDCARRSAGDNPPPAIREALAATEQWIKQPTEEHRRSAFARAEAADLGTPAGSAALAVFLSGGSIAPPEVDAVEPPPHAAAKAIAGSIILAAVSTEPERAPEKFHAAVTQGSDVANRSQLWSALEARVRQTS